MKMHYLHAALVVAASMCLMGCGQVEESPASDISASRQLYWPPEGRTPEYVIVDEEPNVRNLRLAKGIHASFFEFKDFQPQKDVFYISLILLDKVSGEEGMLEVFDHMMTFPDRTTNENPTAFVAFMPDGTSTDLRTADYWKTYFACDGLRGEPGLTEARLKLPNLAKASRGIAYWNSPRYTEKGTYIRLIDTDQYSVYLLPLFYKSYPVTAESPSNKHEAGKGEKPSVQSEPR